MINYWLLFLCIDWLLFIGAALTVIYMLVFALAAIFNKPVTFPTSRKQNRFIILIPAYKQDKDIIQTVNSVLGQSYPQRMFDVVVISDHQSELTNMHLAQLPITLLTPNFEESTKVKSLQYAILNLPEFKIYDVVVVIDGQSIVEQDYLEKMNNAYEASGTKAIVSHNIPKNRETAIARVDSVFEEINNAIFRRAHNLVGLSSAINSSGTAYDFTWFKANIMDIRTNNTEKEIEIRLLRQNIFIDYVDDIFVYDEKAHATEEFNRQRRMWIINQLRSALTNIHHLPLALFHRQYDLSDKIVQWMLIPRFILIIILFIMSTLLPFIYLTLALKWWLLGIIWGFACAIATPDYLVDKNWDRDFMTLPFRLLKSILYRFINRFKK